MVHTGENHFSLKSMNSCDVVVYGRGGQGPKEIGGLEQACVEQKWVTAPGGKVFEIEDQIYGGANGTFEL